MASTFAVTAGSGSLRASIQPDVVMHHAWTEEGVTVQSAFTGAHLLHLAVAACVLNDLYREAALSGVTLNGVRVTATGDFDRETWRSSGISYCVEIDSDAPDAEQRRLIELVDDVAEIPRALRQQSAVTRVEQLD
jgi:uncharacterized OsmC-like protein